MKRTNELGLGQDDLSNLNVILEDLMDVMALLNVNEYSEENLALLHETVDYATFITGGILYKHGFDMLAHHDHDDDEEEDDEE